jgi:large subunit ribosomal protein L3
MPCGIVGRKLEMTRIFQEDGIVTPITYIKCQKNIVSQVKSGDKCGYKAIVVATDECKRQTKTKKYKTLKEFSVEDVTKYKAGDEVPLKMLEPGSLVTVKGVGKGKRVSRCDKKT